MIKKLDNLFPEILIYFFNKKKIINIKYYIEKNSFFLKKEYLDFCKNIENIKLNNISLYSHFATKNNHNFWEMSLIKEKSIIKSKKIYEVIIFLALKKIVNHYKKVDKIILYNFTVSNQVINFFKTRNVELILPNHKFDRSLQIKSFLKNFFLLYNFFNLCILIKKLFSGANKKFFRDTENNFVVFAYFAHYFYKKKKLIFNQFGDLTELLKTKFALGYQHIFVPSKNNRAIKSLPFLIKNNCSFLNANINFHEKIFIILKFIFYSFKFFYLKKKILLKLKDSDAFIFLILSEDYDSSFCGYVLLENLIWIQIFENYLSKTKKKKYGIFLLENQAWEKALVTAWKNYGHGDIIGYTPTSINYWHMYNFDNSSNNYSSPTKIFISSTEGYKLLKRQYDNKKIKIYKIESLWFNYLIAKKIIINKYSNLVLILGDYDPINNYKVFDIVSNSNLIKKNRVLFKAHPHDLTKYTLENIDQTKESNNYFFNKASLIISAGSTAAVLEYLYFGKKVFIYDNPFNLDFSPVKHLKYKLRFSSIEDFNNLLKTNINRSSVIKNFNNYYFLNKNLKKWREFFKLKK